MGPIAHDSKEVSQCNIHMRNNGVSLRVYQLGSVGNGPTVLLLHGFPECWYSWRHQMGALHTAGFHVVAIDLRGYGLSDVPERQEDYTCMHYVGDLVGLLDALSLHQVFVIGHDWGALVGWDFCLLRPDRVKGYVAVSVPFSPRLADTNLLRMCTEHFGEGFYMNRFQIPGKFEAEIAEAGISKTLQILVTTDNITPEMLSKPFDISNPAEVGKLPHWFTEDDLKYYTEQFEISGFTGPLNYYRNIER